jgi:hypothetical protein
VISNPRINGGLVKYRVFFHQGDELGLKTRVTRGEAWLDDAGLHVSGPSEILIPNSDFIGAELFRLHGLGRVIRVEHRHGRLFLSVVRFMIGQFALINFFKTGKLHQEITAISGDSVKIKSNS